MQKTKISKPQRLPYLCLRSTQANHWNGNLQIGEKKKPSNISQNPSMTVITVYRQKVRTSVTYIQKVKIYNTQIVAKKLVQPY